MNGRAEGVTTGAARMRNLRHRVYVTMEGGRASGTAGAVLDGALIALIVANVVAYTLQSVPAIEKAYLGDLVEFEIASVAIFTVEYALRLWSAPEDPLLAHRPALRGRLVYALRPMMLIDFLAIAPTYLAPFFPVFDFRILRMFRLLRLLKIARYSPALSTLMQVVAEERRALLGVGLLALPVGIIATGFVNAIHRRDFVVTFGMLARVPLFHEFEASVLGEIMSLLRAQAVPQGGIISARGEPARAMYFIVSGEVEAVLPQRRIRFGPGDFFGELALLHEATREATIVAVSPCRLLALAAGDFTVLMGRHPELARLFEELAEKRLKTFGGQGDISKEEVAQAGKARDDARSEG